jgi:intracellular sulfur oxidation DsrE/DsrF family protein
MLGKRPFDSKTKRSSRLLAIIGVLSLGPHTLAHAAPAIDPMTSAPIAGYYAFQKVVYQNDGGFPDDRAYFQRLLRNIDAHLAATQGNVEIRVVSFAAGVKLFQMANSDPELAEAIDRLRARRVRFLVCRNTIHAMNLKPEDLYNVPSADIVPSGVAELARLQGLGFVYVHP